MQRAIGILGGAIIVFGATQVLAGELQVGRVVGRAGQAVTVPVTFRAGTGAVVTALSTDIRFDKELANPRCGTGAAMAGGAADKVVSCAEVSPGLLRVLIYGFNQDPMPNGEVATVTFDVLASVRHRLHRLVNLPDGSDANGNGLRIGRKSGTVRLGAK